MLSPSADYEDVLAAYCEILEADEERIEEILREFWCNDPLYYHASKVTQDPRKLLALALFAKMEAEKRCIDLLKCTPPPPIVIQSPEGVMIRRQPSQKKENE